MKQSKHRIVTRVFPPKEKDEPDKRKGPPPHHPPPPQHQQKNPNPQKTRLKCGQGDPNSLLYLKQGKIAKEGASFSGKGENRSPVTQREGSNGVDPLGQ